MHADPCLLVAMSAHVLSVCMLYLLIFGHLSSSYHLFYSKTIDGDQDLCEMFRNLANTEDVEKLQRDLIQCILEMGENTLRKVVRTVAEKLEVADKVRLPQ